MPDESKDERTPFGRRRASENRATIVTYRDDFAQHEIAELAEAAGYTVQALLPQKVVVKSEYGVGVGKAAELFEVVSDNDSNTLIIDEELTSSQANNLSKVTHVEVVDRDRLILDVLRNSFSPLHQSDLTRSDTSSFAVHHAGQTIARLRQALQEAPALQVFHRT